MISLAKAIQAAETAHPTFGWLTAPSTPNGRYHIDRNATLVYVDGRLDIASGFDALLEAIDLLLGGGGNVIPLVRHLPAAERNRWAMEG